MKFARAFLFGMSLAAMAMPAAAQQLVWSG